MLPQQFDSSNQTAAALFFCTFFDFLLPFQGKNDIINILWCIVRSERNAQFSKEYVRNDGYYKGAIA